MDHLAPQLETADPRTGREGGLPLHDGLLARRKLQRRTAVEAFAPAGAYDRHPRNDGGSGRNLITPSITSSAVCSTD